MSILNENRGEKIDSYANEFEKTIYNIYIISRNNIYLRKRLL